MAVDADEVGPLHTLTQNPTPKDRPKFKIETITPSSTTLDELTALPYLAIDDPLPMNVNGLRFGMFIFRSCLPEITHRLAGDVYVFDRPVEDILNGWSPTEPNDVLTPKRVHLKSDYPILRSLLANILVAGTDNQYEWSIGTASVWIAALCRVIKEPKTRLGYALGRLILTSSSLHFLSFGIPIRQLLSLNSIQVALNRARKYFVDYSTAPDDGAEMAPERGEDASSMFLRYLRSAVAWVSAMNYIFHGVKSSRTFKDITLNFAMTPLASPNECAPEGPFVDGAVTYMLKKLGSGAQSEKAKELIEEFKKTVLPVAFRGTVHCEASLMGMIVACKDSTIPLPTGVRREELEVFKNVVTDNGVGVIGVGKKCCWCCSQLAEQLNIAHPHISLQVPASHGLVFPWALPSIGISLAIAESLETALKEVWHQQVGKFAEEFDKRSGGIQSGMSSPSDSISEAALDALAEELLTRRR
ncbi:hypothetical protein BS47DRAFT_1350567 [Hydnum rufescens UP504]|uniref:Uncharacterized protein n=1 Tax=Hydnum rufescens UP504 TaxID=1448309 RepID=A0A9P6DRA6_9AGAM|nr:hypothetical protein BS47DRAFT_1350567 [Hydnum rufescens UP504]